MVIFHRFFLVYQSLYRKKQFELELQLGEFPAMFEYQGE